MVHAMNKFDALLQKANKNLSGWQEELNHLVKSSADSNHFSTEETIFIIQLVLELRLNTQDALAIILDLNQDILSFLGIQPQQSSNINLDRMAYAVGHEDLKELINILSLVVGSFSKLLARYQQKTQASFKSKAQAAKKTLPFLNALKKAVDYQKQFILCINSLHTQIKQLIKHQDVGPLYDDIAALRGPINQFHQALMNGLGKTKQLYMVVNKDKALQLNMGALLKKVEATFKQLPSTNSINQNYHIRQFDNGFTSEQLEARSRAKRMRPFFS